MADKTKQHLGGVSTPLAALAATVLLLATAPTNAGWMPRGIAVAGAAHSLKKNLGESVDLAGEIVRAAFEMDAREVGRLSEEMKRLPGKIVRDAFPVLAAGAGAVGVARSSGQKLKEGLKSAERKIGRFVAGVGGTIADARAALAIDEGERGWYESKTGILGKAPLPKPAIAIAASAPNNVAGVGAWSTGQDRSEKPADIEGRGNGTPGRGPKSFDWNGDWSVTDDGWSGWDRSDSRYDDEVRYEARVGYFALHCWGVEAVDRRSPFYPIMKKRMEDNNCPNENADQALTDDWDDRDGAQDDYTAALADALGDDEDASAGSDYAAALSALEAREAEALRKAERRQQEEAERRRQEEAERLAVAQRRHRAEEREQREFEEELAAARRSQQTFQNTFNQGIQMLNQQLQMLQSIQAGQGRAVGSGSVDDDDYYCPDGNCGTE